MSTILITWELGGGLGHLTTLKPLAEALCSRHQVVMAVRNLSPVASLFDDTRSSIRFLQAPFQHDQSARRVDPLCTFGQILFNVGFGELAILRSLVSAWRTMFDILGPDLVVFDHSPTALLASRGYSFKRVTIGTGFCCPADCHPLPDWRPWLQNDKQKLVRDELQILQNINHLLDGWNQSRLTRVTELFTQVDETLLTTFPELDPFGGREDVSYLGVWPTDVGTPPDWPETTGPRVFGYLKPFELLPRLLAHLARSRISALLYVPGMDPRLAEQFRCPTLRFAASPLDLTLVAQQCDVAILNATHGTTTAMLLAGKPLLLLPLVLEQRLTADRLAALGVANVSNPANDPQLEAKFDDVLANPRYRDAAQRFANAYSGFDGHRQLSAAVARIAQMLSAC